MHKLLISILVFLVGGFHGALAWDASGCGCSVQSSSSCSVDQVSACGTAYGETHRHRGTNECMKSGGECTCSMQPSDAPKPSSDQPFFLQQLSPVAAVPARVRVMPVVLLSTPRAEMISVSLSRVPLSNGRKQAFLSVWRT